MGLSVLHSYTLTLSQCPATSSLPPPAPPVGLSCPQGSAPSLVMGTLPWKCDCPRVLLRAARRMLNTQKDAEHPPTPLCRSHLLCPHFPSSRIMLVLGWIYSSPSPRCMWRWKVSASFPRHLHLLVTTGKYQDLGKTLSMCVSPSTLSYNTLKVRWEFLSFLLACFLLLVSGNWDVTGPFVTEGTGPLHLPVLPWFFCCSGSCLESVLCVWKAFHAHNPWKSHCE